MSKGTGSGERNSKAGKIPPEPRAPRRGDAVDRAIQAFEENLNGKNVTVGDYLRLMQLRKEIDGDEPKDVECTWMEQDETKSSEK
jgi:hypothetical protein